LYWGWQFMQTGWGKFHNLARVAQFFTSLGIPFPHVNAALVASIEFFGGALLIIGLGSRIVGLVLSFNMLMAYITADREALNSIYSSPGKLWRRSLHVPVCGTAGANLRCRFVFSRPPFGTFQV
jgi:putative oxidoreductase